MKRPPSSRSPRKPDEGTPHRGAGPRLRIVSAVGAAAACAVLVGAGVSASSAPPAAEARAAVAAAVDHQSLQAAGSAELLTGALPAAGNEAQSAVSPLMAPNTTAQQPAAQQPAAQQPAVQQPAAPEPGAAPIADLRKASAAFESASGKASAPGARPSRDPDARPPMPDFTGAAFGAALGELQARFDEFAQNEWVQTGSISVTGTERVEVIRVAGVPTHRFSTCVDSSAIEIRDSAGVVVLAAAPAGTRKALNIYDIQQQKGTWVVVGHSFPDSAAC